MTANATREGELLEETQQPFLILTLIGINFRVGALEVNRAEYAWSAMPRTGTCADGRRCRALAQRRGGGGSGGGIPAMSVGA